MLGFCDDDDVAAVAVAVAVVQRPPLPRSEQQPVEQAAADDDDGAERSHLLPNDANSCADCGGGVPVEAENCRWMEASKFRHGVFDTRTSTSRLGFVA